MYGIRLLINYSHFYPAEVVKQSSAGANQGMSNDRPCSDAMIGHSSIYRKYGKKHYIELNKTSVGISYNLPIISVDDFVFISNKCYDLISF